MSVDVIEEEPAAIDLVTDDAEPSLVPVQEEAEAVEIAPVANNTTQQPSEEGDVTSESPKLQVQAALKYARTQKQIMAILKKYDPDGYHIVNSKAKWGDNPMAWWDDYSYASTSGYLSTFDTMVHEETHGYLFHNAQDYNSEYIYLGAKKGLNVRYTDLFRSKLIAKSVPKRLRTGRYTTYVAKPDANLASDVDGIYGLLNEFTAYCWGFNTTSKLYLYAASFDATDDLWRGYVASTGSIALAHAEFRYFMEHYLHYAKTHRPSVYRVIMANANFKKAVKKVDKKFSSLIKLADKRMPKIARRLRKAGYDAYISGDYFYVGTGDSASGTGMWIAQYNRFAKELGKKRYKTIEKKLGLTTVRQREVSM